MQKNQESSVKSFKKFALFTTLFTYFLIFVGGLVRVSGAGLGCPDWPKCFGRWIPPTSIDQLPAHIDPNLFNFTLAWIEYVNRLIGVFLGLFILVTAIWAIKSFRRHPKILYSSITAALLVAIQGWQGSQVVASALESYTISIHMGLAFLIVSFLLYCTFQAYVLDSPSLMAKGARKLKIWVVLLYFLTIVQVIWGTQLRSAFQDYETINPLFRMMNEANAIVPMSQIHTVLGIVLALAAFFVLFRFYQLKLTSFTLLRNSILIMLALVLSQVFIGFILIYASMPALLQIVHLWLASFMVGDLILMYVMAN